MKLCDLIVRFREANHKTQAQLARALGICSSTLCLWEKGDRVPSFMNMVKLARELHTSLDAFAYGMEVDHMVIQITVIPLEKVKPNFTPKPKKKGPKGRP